MFPGILVAILVLIAGIGGGCSDGQDDNPSAATAGVISTTITARQANENRAPTTTPTGRSISSSSVTADQIDPRVASTIASEIVAAAAQAEATGTAAVASPMILDFEGQATATDLAKKYAKIMTVQSDVPFAGPLAGNLEAGEGKKAVPASADVNLRNFVVKTRFAFQRETDPLVVNSGEAFKPVAFTLQFRGGIDGYTALVIYKDSRWELAIYNGQAITTRQEGRLSSMISAGWNELALYVDEIRGYFLLNGELVSILDLASTPHSGDIALALGLPTSAENSSPRIVFLDFTIWAMEPILPTPTPTPTHTPYPTVTPATPLPPEGLGEIILVNETEDRPLTVELPLCPGYVGSVAAGELLTCQIPEGSYNIRAWGWGCERYLPTIKLVRGTPVVLRILPADRDCDFTLSLCIDDSCVIYEPNRLR